MSGSSSTEEADWLRHYPRGRQGRELHEGDEPWTIKVWSPAGEVATGKVDDTSGRSPRWTGPQVAWKMARGTDGAFGGRQINSAPVWLGFCLLFLLGLGDLRRPLSLRNLDLLVLLSFSVSLWFFNRGDIFTSVPPTRRCSTCRPHGLERVAWAARHRCRPVWPVWLLAAATVFTAGSGSGSTCAPRT